ncbi:hypothetical protein MIND_00105300 [Mycena indigotica]|uniref:DUF7918 domain-containing protein n=1 Tax=Mycena indigotica TaxID=2126181 RepID=A0A8H6WFL3_9AGAR|nr:uncharacterized protein MIND_00105300 [Mycena indigotica]KAF7315887.1 hypothetical protein MIND_00105300 [Mycena indigotica]
MPQWHDQFRVWIKIDGVDAEEYGVEVDEAERVVSCWIGSEVGKTFTVEWDIHLDYVSTLCGRVYTDGVRCAGKYFTGTKPHHTFVARAERKLSSLSCLAPLLLVVCPASSDFSSPLEPADDDELLATGPNLPDLGVIELRVVPVELGESTAQETPATLPSLKLHEQSKKAITQQIQLGPARASSHCFRQCTTTGPHLVNFRFKYRPIEILRANGIAPPLERKTSESPTRSESAEPGQDVDDDVDEMKRLEEQLLAVKARVAAKQVDKKPRIKRELIDLTEPDPLDHPPAKKKVKRENGSSEVIDLT